MKKGMKRILSMAIAASLITGNLLWSKSSIAMADEDRGLETMLSTMTTQERQALNLVKLAEENQGLMLNEDVDLQSDQFIDVIVEFKHKPVRVAEAQGSITGYSVNLQSSEELVAEDHRLMDEHLKTMFGATAYSGKSSYINYSYKEAFNGISMSVPANRVQELLDCDSVKAIYSNEEVVLDPVAVQEEDNGVEVKSVDSPELGVNKLHSEGITGKGVKVGVIDTGVDYNHPDLKAVYKGGYDFIDNDNDPMETTYDDWKDSGLPEKNGSGSTYYTQHGTHVSGIIVGQGTGDSDISKKGVAPDAELYAYRVLGKYGTGSSSGILAAIDKAVADDMDVINLSLGANINNHLYPTSIAVNNAVLSGVVAVVAAGNSGPNPYTVGSPGTAALALTVGASSLDLVIPTAEASLTSDVEGKYELRLMARSLKDNIPNLQGVEFKVVDVGFGTEGEYTDKTVEGSFVIITRGKDTLHNLIVTAKKKGAVGVIMQNNNSEEGLIPHYIGEDMNYVPAFSISNAQGETLKSKLGEGIKFTINSLGEYVQKGDTLGKFSSKGPAAISYDIKPEVVAPGVAISSTIPWFMNGEQADGTYDYAYKKLDGTSMAAPYVAGVSALILQENKSMSPMEVKTRVMNTSDEMNEKYSVYEMGAGRVNPYEAVKADTDVKVPGKATVDQGENGTIEINDGDLNYGVITNTTDNYVSTRKVAIENNSGEEKTFKIQAIGNEGIGLATAWGSNGVTVQAQDTVVVPANTSIDVDVTITIPRDAALGTYEGNLVITNENNLGEDYRVPFAANKIKAGAGNLYLDSNFIATPKGYYSRTIVGAASIFFKLSTPMKTIDFIILDGNTEEPIGWVGALDPSGIIPNYEYRVEGFKALYKPMTKVGDDYSIGYELESLNTGNYKFRMLSTDASGEVFTKDFPFYVDNELPAIEELNITTVNGTMALEGPIVYEMDSAAEKNIILNGKFSDADLQKMIDAGIDPYSRPRFENYYQLSATGAGSKYQTQKDGTVTATITPSPMLRVGKVELQAVDATGNTSINNVKTMYLVKPGTPYVKLMPDKDIVNEGDDQRVELSVHNGEDLTEVNFSYRMRGKVVKLDELRLLPEYKDKAVIEYTTFIDEDKFENIEGKIIFKEPLNAPKEGVKVAEFMLEHKNDYWYNSTMSISGSSNYVKSTGDVVRAETVDVNYRNNPSKVLTRIQPYWAEGLTYEVSGIIRPTLGDSYDYSTIGLKTTVEDLDGKGYETFYDKESYRMSALVPFENKSYKLVFDLPGHFTVYRDFKVDRVDQIKLTYFHNVGFERAIAGDVNKDEVIDIKDALFISDNFLRDTRAADINYDGVVDSKDLGYVIKNYGIKNPTTEVAQEPVLEVDGIALGDIVKDLEDGVSNLGLQLLINKVNEMDSATYTEETWKLVANALEKAVAVNENSASTQEQVNEAKANLEEAISALIKAVVKNHLQLAVEEAEKVSKEQLDKIVPVAAKEFKEALKEAQQVLKDKNATQQQVDGSWNRLTAAMDNLTWYKGDKTSLIALVKEIAKLNPENFFEGEWTKLQEVLVEAEAVIANENAMEKEVSEVYDKLMKAFLELKTLPNKANLQELINKADGLDKSKYTEKSWKKLGSALEAAKEVLSNRAAEEAEVDNAVKSLKAALDGLVEKDNEGGNEGGNEGDGGHETKPDTNLPETGGAMGSGAFAMVGILASIAGVRSFRRRRK